MVLESDDNSAASQDEDWIKTSSSGRRMKNQWELKMKIE